MNSELRYKGMEAHKKVFFLGIGGISMSTLAFMASERGIEVTGSDQRASDMTGRLEAAGITVHIGHAASNLGDADALVYTAAVKEDNPEFAAARERGIPCIRRADYLGWLMSAYPVRIGIAGMHGKSTATSMVSHIYLAADLDPTIAVGAELSAIGGAYRCGKGDSFLFEACEYTDSFLSFCPTTAVVLNIDMDHPDYFADLDQIKSSFRRYLALAECAVVNFDDANIREIVQDYKGRLITVGASGEFSAANFTWESGFARFDILRGDEVCIPDIKLSVPGAHNVTDALCAAAAAYVNGVAPEAIAKGLADFRGAHRRFEYRGMVKGARLYDDYAHHPTEIRATLKAAKSAAEGRVICIFQPHTYSRTAELFEDFAEALTGCDRAVLVDIYAAREVNTYGVSSAQLAEAIPGAIYCDSFASAANTVKAMAEQGDLIFTMGAGDVYKIGDMML
ncbi:MAG: UDP-N-acetylmuramate--L-alanine ligase [Clostridia bacterium]|nr:UDP-N-acetylmuramate--L-alanine ligase [Clostridia bacterium]